MAKELFHASVVELSKKLANKEVSAVELANVYLDRIEKNKDLKRSVKPSWLTNALLEAKRRA